MEKTEVEELVTEMFESTVKFARNAISRPNGLLVQDNKGDDFANAECQVVTTDVSLGLKMRRMAHMSPDVDLKTLLFISGVCYGKTRDRTDVQQLLMDVDGSSWPLSLDELRYATEKLRDLIIPSLMERVASGETSREQADRDAALTCWTVGCTLGTYLNQTSDMDKMLEELQ